MFITFFELIISILSVQFWMKSNMYVFYNIHPLIKLIIFVQLVISIYFIYIEYKEDVKHILKEKKQL